jgi:ParB-like chromosome segregation protein Spo0J
MRDCRIEKEIKERMGDHVSWKFVETVRLDEIDIAKSKGNQARPGIPIDEEIVTTYRTNLLSRPYPPIVAREVGDELLVLDGNHRVAAAESLHLSEYPHGCYVVACSDRQADDFARNANTAHGVRLSRDQSIEQAVYSVTDLGVSIREASESFSIPDKTIGDAIRAKEAKDRAYRLGVSIDRLSITAQRNLQRISRDQLFKEVGSFANREKLSAVEIDTIVREMNPKTDESALAYLDEKMEEREALRKVSSTKTMDIVAADTKRQEAAYRKTMEAFSKKVAARSPSDPEIREAHKGRAYRMMSRLGNFLKEIDE